MKIKIFTLFALITLVFAAAGNAPAQSEKIETAAASNLLEAALPSSAARLDDAVVPAEFKQLLGKLVAGGGAKIKQGGIEVLVWRGGNNSKRKTAQLMQETAANIRKAGWNYEIAEQSSEITFFAVSRIVPKRRAAIGFWASSDEALVLALTEMLPADAADVSSNQAGNSVKTPKNISTGNGGNSSSDQPPPGDAEIFNLAAADEYVNVMGSRMPQMPAFPALAKKPGKARGYVRDLQGNPLEGAYIGVRATAVGGFYSGAHTETDAKGYYEIDVPWGASEFYAAGYTIDYGEGRAAVSLYPADGKANGFASAAGAVENFVLIYHGLVDRNAVSEKPWDGANYYGGSIRVSYALGAAGDMWATKGSLPENAEIEITLAPEGALLDGTAGKSFVVRRQTGGINNFNINNIPLGRYKIGARLTNGKPLKMRKTGYDYAPLFGLKPGEAVGTASVLFVPYSADPNSSHPGRANWKPADVSLQMP